MIILGHEISDKMLAESEVTKATIRRRLNRGWTIEEALYGKQIKTERVAGYDILSEDLAKAKKRGISKQTIRSRIYKGMTLEQAMTAKPFTKAKGMKASGVKITIDQLEIARNNGVKDKTLRQRIASGWSVERAIVEPVKQIGRPSKYPQELLDRAERNGITRKNFAKRIRNGWSPEDAANVPYNKSREDLTETEEMLAWLGRMKYLNRTQDEIYNPAPLMKKLKVTWDDIKEIKC